MSIVQEAKTFATIAHGSILQCRKYTGEPYITHPEAVVGLLQKYVTNASEEMLAAAWLHDVVEDTPVTLNEVRERFGNHIATLVENVTDVSRPEDGNRKTRKAIDRVHLSEALPEAKTIKLADIIHNTQSIVEHAPEFAKIYLEEKRLLLEVLKEGSAVLWAMAYDQITKKVK
jgi:(p)ppGpp synthase/HD superfamily hydrolase